MRSKDEIEEYKTIFQFDKLTPILEQVEKLNPEVKKQFLKTGEDVLEL